jgi:hypothetical protein
MTRTFLGWRKEWQKWIETWAKYFRSKTSMAKLVAKFREAVAIYIETLGPGQSEVGKTYRVMSNVLQEIVRLKEADAMKERANMSSHLFLLSLYAFSGHTIDNISSFPTSLFISCAFAFGRRRVQVLPRCIRRSVRFVQVWRRSWQGYVQKQTGDPRRAPKFGQFVSS